MWAPSRLILLSFEFWITSMNEEGEAETKMEDDHDMMKAIDYKFC